MYFLEWGIWGFALDPAPDTSVKKVREEFSTRQAEREEMFAKRGKEAWLSGPVYACNDTYLELRCGAFEHKRGLLTLAVLIWWLLMGMFCWAVYDGYLFELELGERGFSNAALVYLAATLLLPIGMLFVYLRYVFKYTRVEMFTTRHLIARFNRITRQVYIHRPKNCGGIVVMPWEETICQLTPGMPMVLAWDLQDEKYGEYGYPPVLMAVGRVMKWHGDQGPQWEYIRRYMDEGGLAAVKKPRRIYTHFPSLIQAFESQYHDVSLWHFIKEGQITGIIIDILMLPGSVPIKLAHWFSLLTCVRPRWPKIIREAGQPGKPVPKISTIDDYPPEIAARLKANAYSWKPAPLTEAEKAALQEAEETARREEEEAARLKAEKAAERAAKQRARRAAEKAKRAAEKAAKQEGEKVAELLKLSQKD